MFISIYELAYCLLLSAGYCSKEKLDSTKKLNNYSTGRSTGSMKTSPDSLLLVYMS